MHFKLLIAFVDEDKTEKVLDAARDAGATGATVINQARGEGLDRVSTFLSCILDSHKNVIMFLVEEHMCKDILETIAIFGEFDKVGGGIAIKVNVEDAVGVTQQIKRLTEKVEEQL